jgi:flagellar biosynthetic protein FliR
MSIENVFQSGPTFALVFFRVAGMMLFAPLFGSARIPRRMKVLLALILSLGLMPLVNESTIVMPETSWGLAAAIGGEMMFGLAMGMILSLIFIAAQWAGEMIGQQMGFNLSEVFDPQFGAQGSIVGELYYMLTLVVFLSAGGHHALLQGVAASFEALPLLTIGVEPHLFEMVVGLLRSSTQLAIQLAAPMFVTMLVVDVALGFISKTMPQINIMSAGLSLRSAVGMGVLVLGIGLTSDVIGAALLDSMHNVSQAWTGVFAI